MVLPVKIDYFLKQYYAVDLCNGKVLCSLRIRTKFLNYYLDELRLQRVNIREKNTDSHFLNYCTS
jgi:hypothetical protein